MIEVFKTNVGDQRQAGFLIDLIHESFTGYQANFDLEDCDRILRVAARDGFVHASHLISLLKNAGFHAEVLPDEPTPHHREISTTNSI